MIQITHDVADAMVSAPLYSKEGQGFDSDVVLCVFDPYGRGVWLIVEAEQRTVEDWTQRVDWLCFAYVVSPLGPDCDEWGYLMLSDLLGVSRLERSRHMPKGATVRAELERRKIPIPY